MAMHVKIRAGQETRLPLKEMHFCQQTVSSTFSTGAKKGDRGEHLYPREIKTLDL